MLNLITVPYLGIFEKYNSRFCEQVFVSHAIPQLTRHFETKTIIHVDRKVLEKRNNLQSKTLDSQEQIKKHDI